ncbi:putative efflux protein, MATE family [Seinonella peptonophila]|uniref:Putative efflux protein, MATE family n=1 Tax=Seinonella peptonophila TaxID=112248 RepID=A0A1M4VPA5_9BACL|nr:MATE family efflux transporter [Seinonella peptonophila]SHE70884.1 putative efflux protein, MATE family [Seinonella peptonophila]
MSTEQNASEVAVLVPDQEESTASAQSQQVGHVNPDLLDPQKAMWKPLLIFLIPFILSNVLQSLGGTVGSSVVGKGIGETALASLNVVMPVMFFMISFVFGLGSASSVLIGQAFGAGDQERIRKTVNTSLKFALILGVIVGIAGYAFARDLLILIQSPPTIIEGAVQFSRVMFIGMPLWFVYIIYTTFLRGTGDSKTPLYFLIISTALQILFSPWFAFGWLGVPAFGLVGVAFANILSLLITMIILVVYLAYKKHLLALDWSFVREIGIDREILLLMVKIGIPTSIQMVSVSLSELAVIFLINMHGERAVAAYGAVIQVITYVQMPAISLSMAVGIFGSQLIGARAVHRLGALLRSGILLNYIMGIILVGISYLFSEYILAWFLVDPVTLEMAQKTLLMVLWSYMIFGHAMIVSGLMRSSGTVFWPTVIGIFTVWGVQVPVAYLLSKVWGMGLDGIWLAYPVSFTVSLLLEYGYYYFFWKNKDHGILFAEKPE